MSADAIILIPGIKGNHLVDTNTHNYQPVWRDVRFNFQSVEDLILTDAHNGRYYDENMNVIIHPGEVESLAYREFMDDLETDLPKFYFTYDWRLSNRENAGRLHDFIRMLKAKSEAIKADVTDTKVIEKVNIVTHSMGNHICRFYINDYGFNSIHKVAFVTPPFLGSLAMVEAFITGHGWFNMKKRTRRIVKSFPGAIELLPRYDKAAVFENGGDVDFFNPDHWQSSVLKTNTKDDKKLTERFMANLAQAKNDLAALDQWKDALNDDEKSRIMVVVRDEFKTLQAVKVTKQSNGVDNVVDFGGGLENKEGDKVVPNASSCCYCKDLLTLAILNSARYDDDSHAFFMTEERVQDLVSWFFDDSQAFNYRIPGNSIRRITDIQLTVSGHHQYWQTTKE